MFNIPNNKALHRMIYQFVVFRILKNSPLFILFSYISHVLQFDKAQILSYWENTSHQTDIIQTKQHIRNSCDHVYKSSHYRLPFISRSYYRNPLWYFTISETHYLEYSLAIFETELHISQTDSRVKDSFPNII